MMGIDRQVIALVAQSLGTCSCNVHASSEFGGLGIKSGNIDMVSEHLETIFGIDIPETTRGTWTRVEDIIQYVKDQIL